MKERPLGTHLSIKKIAIALLVASLSLGSTQSAIAGPPVSGIGTTAFNEGSDKAAVFYNPLVVSNINLTLPPASYNELNNNPSTVIYQRASVTITTADSKVTTLNDIGVRIKGQATRTNFSGKTALKLKFDAFVPGQSFLGLSRMTLNSMVQDPSFIHESTAYRLYRAMGVIAPRTTYSWLTLNNVDFGLYANVESVDNQMLKRWVTAKHVYSSNCYLADLTYYQSACYDTNYGDSNRSDLNSAIAVSTLDGEAWWTAVNKVADMDAVIKLMATDIYTSNWDGYTDVVQNNYYIVFDLEGKLKIIPWGQDGAFPMDAAAQLDFLGQGPAYRGFGNQQRSVMLRKCVAYDPCQSLLVKAQVVAKNKADEIDMIGFKNKVAAVINSTYISRETRSNADVGSAIYWQNWLNTFFPMRTNSLTNFLKTRKPEAPTLALTGEPTPGSTLTASASTWDFTSAIGYQWLKNNQVISGAIGSTYLVKDADDAGLISVRATTTKTGQVPASTTSSQLLVSNPRAAVASIRGDAKVGAVLTAYPLATPSTVITYSWSRAGKAISGATSSTYTPTTLDYLKTITVTTTVSQTGYAKVVTTSPPLSIEAGDIVPPPVAIAGTPSMGNTLLINAEIPYGMKASFQWLRDGVAISGGTRSYYVIKSFDVEHSLTARVAFSKTGYIKKEVSTGAVTVSKGVLTKTPVPVISGIAALAKSLSANTGTWDTGVKVTYVWLRDGQPIVGTMSKMRRLTLEDVGRRISFQVTASKPGFESVILTSNVTEIVTR